MAKLPSTLLSLPPTNLSLAPLALSRPVPIHRHALRVPAELAFGRWADGSTALAAGSAALLESQQLLGAEGLVVDLRGRLDQVLQVGAGEEVAEVDEFAVVLVLDCLGTCLD